MYSTDSYCRFPIDPQIFKGGSYTIGFAYLLDLIIYNRLHLYDCHVIVMVFVVCAAIIRLNELSLPLDSQANRGLSKVLNCFISLSVCLFVCVSLFMYRCSFFYAPVC